MPAFSALLNYISSDQAPDPVPAELPHGHSTHPASRMLGKSMYGQPESYSLYHSCLSSAPEGRGEHKSNEGSTEPRRFSRTVYILIFGIRYISDLQTIFIDVS